jgi:hypothetical protein
MSEIEVPAVAIRRSRERIVAMAQAMRRRRRVAPLRSFPRVALAGLAAILAAFLGLGGLLAASAQSLPGDTLYPIKRAGESVSLELSASAASRQALQDGFSQRRSSEVLSLLDLSRSAPVSFQGVVRRQSVDSLLVGNIPVSLPKDAEIVGNIEDGVIVEVEGETYSGSVQARQVRLRAFELDGPVQSISGSLWKVADTQFVTDPDTLLTPGIGVGDSVIVMVEIDEQGHTRARSIRRAQAAEPAPQTTPTLLATANPMPTPPETESPDGGGTHQSTMEFSGTLQSIAGSTWTVGGRGVHVGAQSQIDGNPRIGDTVKVQAGVAPDGSLQALKIEVISGSSEGGSEGGGSPSPTPTPNGGSGGESGEGETHNDAVTLTGTVTAISAGSWTVGGRAILVNGATEIQDNLSIGDPVKVTAFRQSDGSLLASKIERQSN